MLLTTEPSAVPAPVFFNQVPSVLSGQKEGARFLVWYCLPCQTLHLDPEPLCWGSNRTYTIKKQTGHPQMGCCHVALESPDLRALIKLVADPSPNSKLTNKSISQDCWSGGLNDKVNSCPSQPDLREMRETAPGILVAEKGGLPPGIVVCTPSWLC